MFNVVYAIDKNLYKAHYSLKTISHNSTEQITFHIITKSKEKYEYHLKSGDAVKYYTHDRKTIETNIEHINSYCFVLFDIPKIVKLNKYLYLDYDIYSLNYDISEIFKNNKDPIHMNIDTGVREFNTGVVLINNDYFKKFVESRSQEIEKRSTIFRGPFHDQHLMNEFIKDDELTVSLFHDIKVNILINRYNINNIPLIPEKCLVHTNHNNKIWDKNSYNKMGFLFKKIKESVK